MPVMAVAKFERFFRSAAELDVDESDLKRYDDFVNQKVYDLLVRSVATAKANGRDLIEPQKRDLIEPQDLPIAKGLRDCMCAFRELDEIELQPMLDEITARPPLDADPTDETEARLPSVVGSLSVALARSFRIVDPALKRPYGEQWDARSACSSCSYDGR